MSKSKELWQSAYKNLDDPDEIWTKFEERQNQNGFDSAIIYSFSITDGQNTSQIESWLQIRKSITSRGVIHVFGGLIDAQEMIEWALSGNKIEGAPYSQHLKKHSEVVLIGCDFCEGLDDPDHSERRFFENQYSRFGARNGVLVPLRMGGPGAPSGITLYTSQNGAYTERLFESRLDRILLECHLFASAFDVAYRKKISENMGLSLIQYTVLQALCAGHSNKQISELLNITEATVSYHFRSLQRILEVASVRELPAKAFRLGLVSLV